MMSGGQVARVVGARAPEHALVRATLLLVIALLACEGGHGAAVFVEVITDLGDVSWFELRVRSQSGTSVRSRAQRPWPTGSTQSFNIVPAGDDLAASPDAVFEVVAATCGPEVGRVPDRCASVTRRARVQFREGQVVRVRLSLAASCRGIVCPAGMSCDRGACVAERVDPNALADGGVDAFASDVSLPDRLDAPVLDAGDADAAPSPDRAMCPAGTTRCGPACADFANDAENCGACGVRCAEGIACGGGRCVRTRQIAVFERFSCALLDDDSVRCWGEPEGSLQSLGLPVQTRPRAIPNVRGTRELAFGVESANCVVSGPDQLSCWNRSGVMARVVPAPFSPIAQLDCGYAFCCVRGTGGQIGCWGRNAEGQLGDGTRTARDDLRAVTGVAGATHLSCGERQCCAVLGDGEVRCWGSNGTGQFGNGTGGDVQPSPVAMRGLAGGATRIATDETVSCAAMRDGTVRCVGGDFLGQRGDGAGDTSLREAAPTRPISGRVVDVQVGVWNVCARTTDGAAWCWGTNYEYQTGAESRSFLDSPTRLLVPTSRTVSGMSLGTLHMCATLDDGSARCWGNNVMGQLGNGRRDASVTPVQVMGLTGVTQLASGVHHVCATHPSGVFCWGGNLDGQLGDGGMREVGRPVQIRAGTFSRLAAGGHNTCFWGATTGWLCMGDNGVGRLALDPARSPLRTPTSTLSALPSPLDALVLGEAHGCGVSASREVFCWGYNGDGQLGRGTLAESAFPVPERVVGGVQATKVVAGYAFSCALRTTGAVLCWGDDHWGQIGDGLALESPQNALSPQAVVLPGRAVDIFAGQGHACAVLEDGAAWCWGWNQNAQLGLGHTRAQTTPIALPFPGGVRVQTFALGNLHSCALTTAGDVYCWGLHREGQLGVGQDGLFDARSPLRVESLRDVVELSAGWTHTCARRRDGTVWCWGANDVGQLGNGLPEHPAQGFAVRW